ncbi:hypothetical protein F511_08597 [Dorcoceras hygrometricum]|uniref:Uncharacterized protein n=1 Tax=Dorcoceras hygrometricum TaxID=472368 RepID=A0A2Z7BHK3_9LAMI|nr:hypothetical protein F511_08597 [Dorcoceras hygrometricum]
MYSPDVQPKNLKISKSTKTGQISNIGAKTSRAARDRPELNPRKQTSRHDIVGASSDGGRRNIARGACSAQRCSNSRAIHGAQQRSGRSNIVQPVCKIGGQRPASEWHKACAQRRPSAARHMRPSHGQRATKVFSQLTCWRLGAWLRPVSRGNRHFTVYGGRLRQSGPRPEGRLLRQPALEGLTRSARTETPRKVGRNKFRRGAAAQGSRTPQNPPQVLNTLSLVFMRESRIQYLCDPQWKSHSPKSSSSAQHIELSTCVILNGSGIQLAVGPQPLWLRNHNSGLAHRIMVRVSSNIAPRSPRSTTIGKSRVAIDPIAMRTSWRSNSDIASVTSIGYPRMSASGESSTTMHRLQHASGSHPIPPPNDPKQRKNKNLEYREAINTKNSSKCINIHRVFQACYLAGTCAWLQPVFQEPGASRLIAVVTSIRSMTRSETPSSDCTRSPDEIGTIVFSSKN